LWKCWLYYSALKQNMALCRHSRTATLLQHHLQRACCTLVLVVAASHKEEQHFTATYDNDGHESPARKKQQLL
jgi:hypothetical protein